MAQLLKKPAGRLRVPLVFPVRRAPPSAHRNTGRCLRIPHRCRLRPWRRFPPPWPTPPRGCLQSRCLRRPPPSLPASSTRVTGLWGANTPFSAKTPSSTPASRAQVKAPANQSSACTSSYVPAYSGASSPLMRNIAAVTAAGPLHGSRAGNDTRPGQEQEADRFYGLQSRGFFPEHLASLLIERTRWCTFLQEKSSL